MEQGTYSHDWYLLDALANIQNILTHGHQQEIYKFADYPLWNVDHV